MVTWLRYGLSAHIHPAVFQNWIQTSIQFFPSLLWTHTTSVTTNTEDDWCSLESGSTEGRMSKTWRIVFWVLPVNLVHTWPITGLTAGVVVGALKCCYIAWMSMYVSLHKKKSEPALRWKEKVTKNLHKYLSNLLTKNTCHTCTYGHSYPGVC